MSNVTTTDRIQEASKAIDLLLEIRINLSDRSADFAPAGRSIDSFS